MIVSTRVCPRVCTPMWVHGWGQGEALSLKCVLHSEMQHMASHHAAVAT